MAIGDFFRALANPEVQDQLAAMSYAYGPQASANGVGARFANLNDYMRHQKMAALEERMTRSQIEREERKAALEDREIEREQKARDRMQEQLRAAQLMQNLPTREQDLAGSPQSNAPLATESYIQPMLGYMMDTGNLTGAGYLMQQQQLMEQTRNEQQAAQQEEQAIQAALANPQVRQQLGPAAELILRRGGAPMGRGLFPSQGGGGSGGAGGTLGSGPFGAGLAGRSLNILMELQPMKDAGQLSPEQERLYNMALSSYTASVTAGQDVTGEPRQKVDIQNALGGQPGSQPAQSPQVESVQEIPSLLGPSVAQSTTARDVGTPLAWIREKLSKAPVHGSFLTWPKTNQAMEYARQIRRDAIREMQESKGFPVGEMKAIEKDIEGLDPKFLNSYPSYRAGVLAFGRRMQEKLDQSRYKLTQPIPVEEQKKELARINTLPFVLQSIGVYHFDSIEEAEAASDQVPEGSFVRVRNPDGTWSSFELQPDE